MDYCIGIGFINLEEKKMTANATKQVENARLWALKAYELTVTNGTYEVKEMRDYASNEVLQRIAIEKRFVEKVPKSIKRR